MVHFALVFPERKPVLDRWPVLWLIYGYFALVNILYLAGITAYDASLPFLFFWSAILVLTFVHSMVRHKDPFLRRQIFVSIAIPAFVVVVFIVFNADPGAMGTSSTRFATFAMFALLMPFALMAAMDNIFLYRQRLAVEKRYYQEREEVRQALHDDTLNKLANIALLSETSLHLLERDAQKARDKIQSIKHQAADYSQTIRQLLRITDQRYGNWMDFSSLLRNYGYDAADGRGVTFDLVFTQGPAADDHRPPTAAVTVTLYHIFVEALANALRHANPHSVLARLHLDRSGVCLSVADDGNGFRMVEIRSGHYGLPNMTRRAQAMDGVLSIHSRPGEGTRIEATLPLDEAPK